MKTSSCSLTEIGFRRTVHQVDAFPSGLGSDVVPWSTHGAMVIGSIPHGRLTELFVVK